MARICLDAGHGGRDSGACAFGRTEKNDVLRLTLQVGEILKEQGHEIYFTRINDIYESVVQKAREANAFGADFFASFHRNSALASALGFETLVYANSGKAKTCADYANTKMHELGFRNRGTKVRTDLAVLNSTSMEAVLFEVGFISNTGDNHLFDSKFDTIAKELANAILVAIGCNKPISNGNTPVAKPTAPTAPSYSGNKEIRFTYAVRAGGKIYPEVVNLNDWAGKGDGTPITDITIKVDKGSVRYRVHILGGGWLPWVTGYNWNDHNNGYAGNGKPIDAIQVYYDTPKDYAAKYGYQKAQYRVSTLRTTGFYSWQFDTETEKGQDGYAGAFGTAIDKFQLC